MVFAGRFRIRTDTSFESPLTSGEDEGRHEAHTGVRNCPLRRTLWPLGSATQRDQLPRGSLDHTVASFAFEDVDLSAAEQLFSKIDTNADGVNGLATRRHACYASVVRRTLLLTMSLYAGH